MTADAVRAAAGRRPGAPRYGLRGSAGSLQKRIGTGGMVAAGYLAMLVLVAAFAPLIAPHDPDATDILNTFAPASIAHPLGTDGTGRDILSRLIWGTRTSLAGPALVILISLCIGVPLGLIAAWRGGIVDATLSRVLEIIFSIPGVLLAILAVAVFSPGLAPAVAALSISYLPYVGRIARTAALRERGMPYVRALEVQGASGTRIVVRHILPNIAGVISAQATLAFGYALMDLAALSFLGLAVQQPQSDWGALVGDTASVRAGHPGQVVWASILIVLTIIALTALGDRLSDEEVPLRRRFGRGRRRS